MIKSIHTKLSRPLLLLISFAMLFFITACGGSKDEIAPITTGFNSIAITSTVTSLAAGESSIITATVTDSAGTPVQGETVKFSILINNSDATSQTLNGGQTDAKGQAVATYTAGPKNPNIEVKDSIRASVSGATVVSTITRISSSAALTGLRMTLSADSSSLAAGKSAIVTATVTNGSGSPAAGQAVTLTLPINNSDAILTLLGLGVTDNSGKAQAIYTAGPKTPTKSVQDTIQASVTGASGVYTITRISNSASSTGLIMTLKADSESLAAGDSTLIRVTVIDGTGAPSEGQTVSFALISNPSGATLNPLKNGITDASGQAIATYTAGPKDPTKSVQDMIQASVTGTTEAVIITRTSNAGSPTGRSLTLLPATLSLASEQSAIITAKVTDGTSDAVQGETVTFDFMPGGNLSGASLNGGAPPVIVTTDAAGEATVLYKAGPLVAAVQDIVQASITGSTKALIINKTGSSGGTTVTAARILLSASPLTVKSDGSTSGAKITVIALNDVSAALSGVTVTLGTDTGVLSAPTVVTNTTTPATVTFNNPINTADPTYAINRTATITAAAGTATAQIPIQIVDSTLTLTSSGTTLPDNGTSSVTLTATLKDSGGNPVSGAVVNWSRTGAAVVFTPSSSTTNGSGQATTTVTSTTAGSVTIIATAPGKGPLDKMTTSKDITVTSAANTFYIDQLNGVDIPNETTGTSMQIGGSLIVRVNAPFPDTEFVMFATTIGKWNGISSVLEVPIGSGKATATLTTTAAGLANVQVYRKSAPGTQDSLTVAMTAKTPYRITLQATPSTVPKSVGSTTGYSTLIATVFDNLGYPVGNVPVSFSIVRTTGGGESVSPVVVYTAAAASGSLGLGEARAQFTSGSLTSDSSGVQIRASVVGTYYDYDGPGPSPPLPVETEPVTLPPTDLTPNGNDAKIIIGEVSGSVAFGMATGAVKNDDKTQYIQNMSVLVADAGGNPVPGVLVTLSAWPIAWSTGSLCAYNTDDGISRGTFRNEDVNENLILDPGEDGTRIYYEGLLAGTPAANPGTKDGYITPTNSSGGVVPPTVTTAANGVASFTLTYPISSAIWTITRIRASAIVSGSETVGQVIFRLMPLASDVGPPCSITGSLCHF